MKMHLGLIVFFFMLSGCNMLQNFSGEMRRASIDELIEYLDDDDQNVRLAASKELTSREYNIIPITPELISALNDLNPRVQENILSFIANSIQSLDNITREEVESLLLDEEISVSISAVKTLGKIGNSSSISALQNLLKKRSDPGIRHETIRAIISLGGAGQSVPLFILVLQESDGLAEKQMAVEGLAAAKQDAMCAIPILINNLRHDDRWFRAANAKAVAEISGENFQVSGTLDEEGDVQIVDDVQVWWQNTGQNREYPRCEE